MNFEFPDEDIMLVTNYEEPGPDEGPEPGSRWAMVFDVASNALGNGIGAMIISPQGGHTPFTARLCFDCTNNMAEYESCILGLIAAIDLRIKFLEVYGDSTLVISQIKVEWDTKHPNLIPYKELVLTLTPYFEEISFEHIPREENLLADVLATMSSMFKVRWDNEAPLITIYILDEQAYCCEIDTEGVEEKPWFHEVRRYLEAQEYPEGASINDRKFLKKFATKFFPSNVILYKRNLDSTLLWCVYKKEADKIMEDMHDDIFGTHSRCKSFMWLFKHTNRLLTNHNKSKKGLGNAGCNRCGNTCETSIHALLYCSYNNQIWQSLITSELKMEFFATDRANWIRLNLNCNSDGWSSTWIIACHALWSWHNEEERNENYLRPLDPITQISKTCREYKQVLTLHKFVGIESIGTNSIGWIPPVRSMITLNTDGANKPDNSSGCGGILQDYKGDWKGGFSKFVGRSSALFAEFLGVLDGLKLDQRLNYFNVEINIDSVHVAKALEDGKVEAIDCVVILSKILEHLSRMKVVLITHFPRSSNSCADGLANRGCLDKALVFYEYAPSFLEPMLHDDKIGICDPSVSFL